jgi:hypothetical protein
MVVQEYDTAKTKKWKDQYNKWAEGAIPVDPIKPAPNGINFLPAYKDWVAVSSTIRTDNGTMRIIAGNDIAVNAVKTNHTNPWPEGTMFAKIIWTQVADSSGVIHAGDFKQVDFMVKGKIKYAATGGWGYARWLMRAQLEPYGENALFSSGCVNCHQSMKNRDYVFTTPVKITADAGLEDRVLTSCLNQQEGSMSTLYGNEIARKFRRNYAGNEYPPGTILTYITWRQKEDRQWFGANVPGLFQSIERISFVDNGKKSPVPTYERYEENSLVKIGNDQSNDEKRMKFILSLQSSVMP